MLCQMRTQDAIIFVIMRTKILVGLPLSSTGRGNHRLRLEILDPASKLDYTVMANLHLHDELKSSARVVAETLYGPVIGARSVNGAAVFLEVAYALPPKRFQDPEPLPTHFRYDNKEHIEEASYAVQPRNDGQAKGLLPQRIQ
ncbi:hypothetical protein PTI98_008126 [Pleurotus ostreatus]|nr:hypothetical protein PTI98_008126 [Pleurotus ostreatus]